MSIGTQRHVEGYLRSAAYNLINTEKGFVVADKPGVGGGRDTLLVWLPSQLFPRRTFAQLEPSLVEKVEEEIARYPDARYIVLVDSLEGISRTFSDIASARGIKIRVPVQFFDAAFRVEEARDAISAIKSLRDEPGITKLVSQPYMQERHGSDPTSGPDLLTHLREDFESTVHPCIRFVVGSAGAGKTVLFRRLFTIMYRDFINRKNSLALSRRPIPFIPEHLRETYAIRTFALVESFLRSEVAAPVLRDTLEWMLENACCVWMFDGLDELYSGDPEFFDYLLELLTRPDSQAQILVCARDSLLSSNDAFVEFLRSFSPNIDSSVRIYRLKDWEAGAKRQFAWTELVGHSPRAGEPDTPKVTAFLNAINATPIVRTLSGLPYYCSLLIDRFKDNQSLTIKDEFDLLKEVIGAMQNREITKGVILPRAFEDNGLDELLEAIATDYCVSNYAGTSTEDIRVYGETVLRSALTDEERQKLVTSLVQPLFAVADRPGIISFKHELLAEYLFGRQLLRTVRLYPDRAASQLGKRPMLRDNLAFRYMVQQISGDAQLRDIIISEVSKNSSFDDIFKTLLQLWISSATALCSIPNNIFSRVATFRICCLQGLICQVRHLGMQTLPTPRLPSASS
jgi:hypothetical protein